MRKGLRDNEWLRQLAFASIYALVYVAVQPLSDGHWALRSGLRLSCLLLMPYRYWLALLVGEAIPNAREVWACLDQYGTWFVAVRCVPPILLFMPIVWWCRSRLALFPTQRLVDIKVMMLCVLLVTSACTGYSYLAISFVHTVAFEASPIMAVAYFIGNYIAILGTVPIVLMARLDGPCPIRMRLRRMASSQTSLDTVMFVLPLIVALSLISLHSGRDIKQIARMSVFLPVAWTTLKHGWRAAAIGGALSIAATCLVTESRPEPEILETQALIALAVTCLLATGARISVQLQQEALKRREDANLQRLARQTLQSSEQRRRQASETLEYLAGSLHVANSRLLEQLRLSVQGSELDAYHKQLEAAQRRVYSVAESLHPAAWRERGLPAALNETVARALDDAGIAYRCMISGRGFMRMSPAVLSAAYRTVCESIVQLTGRLTCSAIHVTFRGGETSGKRWLLLRVDGLHDEHRVANAVMSSSERQRIMVKLGTSALDIDQLRAQARIFNGTLHERAWPDRDRITALLCDMAPDAEGHGKPEPLRLWVH